MKEEVYVPEPSPTQEHIGITQPQTPLDGALYYSRGLSVFKRPIKRAVSGGHAVKLGFRVCTVSEEVGEEGAEAVAAMLTMAENYQERRDAAEPIGCPLPGACACPADGSASDRVTADAEPGTGRLDTPNPTSKGHHP